MGFGYGDGIVDNERMGMTVCVLQQFGKPNPTESHRRHFTYNYMSGLWKNGQAMAYGGDGIGAATGANLDVIARYMFPEIQIP